MTVQDVLNQFLDSIRHFDAERLQDCFIDLTLERHGMDETTQEYMILSEKIELARDLLLERRHRAFRRRGW